MHRLALILVALGTGCASERAPAPDDLNGLTRFMFTHWESEKEISDGMTNLQIWLDGEGRTEEAQDDGFRLGALSEEDVGEITFPGETPLSDLIGVAVSYESPWSIEDHAALVTEPDQRWNAARKYEKFDRVITEGATDAFLAEGAHEVPEFIRTDNDIIQERLGVRIAYTLLKDYRWTETDEGNRAVVARTWAPERGCSGSDGDGNNCVELSFSVDLIVEDDDGETMRFTASWTKLSLSVNLGEDLQVATLANGIRNIFEDTDELLEERSNGE
ncbi:MAG: hypothetical protein AB8H79_17675 [Myxococcota bacterium]